MAMARNLTWRSVFVVCVILCALIYLLPSLVPNLPDWWTSRIARIHLGLDLQGGMHLITEVETDKAIENAMVRYAEDLEDILEEEKVNFIEIQLLQDRTITVEFRDQYDNEKFIEVLEDYFPGLEEDKNPRTGDNFYIVTYRLKNDEVAYLEDSAVRQALETIRNRIDQFGVSEPTIQRQGENRILIQLPGINDPERAKNLLRQTALLEFKVVNDDANIQDAVAGKVPGDSEVLYHKSEDPTTGKDIKRPFVLKRKTLLTGDLLDDAQVRIDSSQFNDPYVSIRFNSKGTKIFKRVTEDNVGKRLAIVLDGVVHSAPVIREPIPGGRASIEGAFTMEEAKDLAIVLRAGSLPAPIKILEERSVGPSLGRDSIEKGFRSILIGAIAVVFFVLIYYKLSGFIANIALTLNIIFIFAALAGFEATLTLPGIAGIVLTIGMAIDANVLIFERIREEIRAGKTTWASIDGGYSKAFWTIIDANITTLIAAMVLIQFGTGPIRGFAVTLCIGIFASLFTAIFVTRILFDYLVVEKKVQKISI